MQKQLKKKQDLNTKYILKYSKIYLFISPFKIFYLWMILVICEFISSKISENFVRSWVMTNSVLIFNNLPVSKSNLVLMPLFFKFLKKIFFYYFIIKSNQIKSFGLGIALGSFMQSGVSIHCVLRFFIPDPHKVVISVTLARIEIINSR